MNININMTSYVFKILFVSIPVAISVVSELDIKLGLYRYFYSLTQCVKNLQEILNLEN